MKKAWRFVALVLACVVSMITPTEYFGYLIPLYVLVAILTGLSIGYVKHYYFLENHIQKLYDLTENFLKK